MTATVVESRTVDPIASWAAILYCAGVVIWPSLTVLS